MAIQWKATVAITPNVSISRSTFTVVPVGLEVAADEISLYIGDDVPIYRQGEILEAWKWLYDGVRERNLLDVPNPFHGAILYTGVSIDSITTENRRTASTIGFFAADDIILAMGADVTGLGDRNSISESFKLLRQFALEETLKGS